MHQVFVSHWMACALGIAGGFVEEGGDISWLHYYRTTYYEDQDHLKPWEAYLGALYWAVMTSRKTACGLRLHTCDLRSARYLPRGQKSISLRSIHST